MITKMSSLFGWRTASQHTQLLRALPLRTRIYRSINLNVRDNAARKSFVKHWVRVLYAVFGAAVAKCVYDHREQARTQKSRKLRLNTSAPFTPVIRFECTIPSLVTQFRTYDSFGSFIGLLKGHSDLFDFNLSDPAGLWRQQRPFSYSVSFKPLLVHSVAARSDAGSRSASFPSETVDDQIASLESELLKEQLRYQQSIFKLEKENQELRRQILLRQEGRDMMSRKLKRNPIEMYSEVLDEVIDLRNTFDTQISLPQIVIVGDTNSGKSSLLEMLLRTRIFPRNEYKPQVPVKFTLCEGPYHLAQFNDTDREFDLENGSDIEELRKELELRVKSVANSDAPASVVSLTIWGPNLSRMVIVDLPALPLGIYNDPVATVSETTREFCYNLLRSPQTLLLCTIDASRDSPYSRAVELVKDFDSDGVRSVFVLTKTDLVETSLADPEKIRRVTDGSLFPLKGSGFYVAVPARGSKTEPIEDVEAFEKKFFSESSLFRSDSLKSTTCTVKNMSAGIADLFWQFVKNSLRYQIDFLKARKAALEKDWKTKFYKARVLDRDELYETGRMQLLDDVAKLNSVPSSTWETEFEENLWNSVADYIFDNVYVPIATGSSKTDFRVATDLRLKAWADGMFPLRAVDVAGSTLFGKFKHIISRRKSTKEHDDIYDNFKETILEQAKKTHQWDTRARENLRSALVNTCEAPYVITPDDWNIAVRFMEQACSDRLIEVQTKIQEFSGPSSWERLFLFRLQTQEHRHRRAVMDQLEKLILPNDEDVARSPELSKDEVNVIQKTLESANIKVDGMFIRETWRYLFLSRFLEQAVQKVALCGEVVDTDDGDHLTHKGDCSDVELFYRVKRMIRTASVALRQQLATTELGRLESEVRQILDGLERDPVRIKQYFNHARIGLAEELKKITTIQEKLEDLQKLLEEEEPIHSRGSFSADDNA
ncbi:dynamin-like 120 kDa protein, mitochondrial [Paramacrobiotus metropolitanus]|uniref:dynamin-like 120 kDa protein, mitochondrial n=1 Tax=Paramacrobiotus metropolitanus TaxID=2943436 RepID=UPI002445FB7A|nr:dynamin-like 120 kDa protein, mitochondrial [Paramacrobiotus metropolitanus]